MIRRPPRSTRTVTRFPFTTLCLSGFATILRKGDEVAGTILLLCLEKGTETGLFERMSDYEGGYRLMPCGPQNGEFEPYLERRINSDPDMRSEEHTYELQSLMRTSYDVLCLQKKTKLNTPISK